MKIVADANIPWIKGIFEPYADVVYASGDSISTATITDADALIIRTRTCCDAKLLENSTVRFIATATIGTDHIDISYCRQKNIAVYSAAGCNASAVMQYVASALVSIEPNIGKELSKCTLGIIGVGNIGRLVRSVAGAFNMRTLLNDPPLSVCENNGKFVELDELLHHADIVTMHVPLTPKTQNMANHAFFEKMKYGAAFINTSRGEITDEQALIHHRDKLSAVVLDVWQNEPHINTTTINIANIATPHIAGYSIQGKRNATIMIVRAAATFFDISELKKFTIQLADKETIIKISANMDSLRADISKNYPIFDDDKLFRRQSQNFELLRNNYVLRNELIFREDK